MRRVLLAGAVGYVAGMLPSAKIASRLAASTRHETIDLYSEGSGNPGATNAAAQLGTKWGLFVLALDVAKGSVGSLAGTGIAGSAGAYAAGAGSIAGHVFPVANGFHGGKGVATSAGASLVLFPAYFPIDAAVVALSAVGTSNADRAIRIACSTWVVAAVAWWRCDLPNAWGPTPTGGLPAFATFSSAVMLTKLRLNRVQPDRVKADPSG